MSPGVLLEVRFFENSVSLGISVLVFVGESVAKLLILMPGEGIEPSLRFP